MAEFTTPSEIAREALRRLALKRTPPTPDNYLALYHEIAGTVAAELFPDKTLKTLVAALPRTTPQQQRMARQFDAAVAEKNWESLKAALLAISTAAGVEQPQWAGLIRELLVQLDRTHVGMTVTKKREMLEHVLKSSTAPDLLFSRMQSLLRSWSQEQTAEAGPQLVEGEIPALPEAPSSPQRPSAAVVAALTPLGGELPELVALLLEDSMSTLMADTPEIAKEAAELAADVRAARTPETIAKFAARMKKFSYRLRFVAEDQAELKTALLHLLQLIIENISELVMDDKWLHGQINVLLDLTQQPLNLRRLDDVERRMKEVIYKQGALKKHLNDAQDRLKAMLASFVDRLADFSESTSGYHDKIERCAEKISKASDVSELSDVLGEVMQETRSMQLTAQRSRDELREMRIRVDEAEKEVSRLQNELAETSEMVRQDPLTGALNRKGMDEVMRVEVARAQRQGSNLCLGMLDIDNFKKLNDTYGHKAGDDALVHLTKVVQEALRPQDTLARYGGEEFVIILPNTTLDEAVQALTRLQRELTRNFFLHENEKMLITFSAGAAELGREESPGEALKRADAAMYLAKRAGKNRVVAA